MDLYSDYRAVRALSTLEIHDCELLQRFVLLENHSAHHILTREGTIEPIVYFLCQGHVNVTQRDEKGEMFLSILGPGDFFGEAAIFHDVARTATVRSLTPIRVITMYREAFQSMQREQPSLANQVLVGMFRDYIARLARTSAEMLTHRSLISRTRSDSYYSVVS